MRRPLLLLVPVSAIVLIIAASTGLINFHKPPPTHNTAAALPSGTGALSTVIQSVDSKLPSVATERKDLAHSGVRATLDGTATSSTGIAERLVGFEQADITHAAETHYQLGAAAAIRSAQAALPPPGSYNLTDLQRAVAYQVLHDLLWTEAQASGSIVSLRSAQTYAEQNYQTYIQTNGTAASPILKGHTPSQAFLNPGAVRAYQQELSVVQEMTVIAGPRPSSSVTGPGRTHALSTWMERDLTSHHLTVHNVQGVTPQTISNFLPPGL